MLAARGRQLLASTAGEGKFPEVRFGRIGAGADEENARGLIDAEEFAITDIERL